MARQTQQQRIHKAIGSLQRLTDVFRERRRQLAEAVDLSEAQWRLLEEIAGEAFMPSMFARQRDCTPAAVSRTLRGLLERGLVSVAIAEDDGRQRVYRLTSAGRRVLRRLHARRERAIAVTWARHSGEDLECFASLAEELSAELESLAAAESRGQKRAAG